MTNAISIRQLVQYFAYILKNNLFEKIEDYLFASHSDLREIYKTSKLYKIENKNLKITSNILLTINPDLNKKVIEVCFSELNDFDKIDKTWLLNKLNEDYKLAQLNNATLSLMEDVRTKKTDQWLKKLNILDINDEVIDINNFDYKKSTLEDIQKYRELIQTKKMKEIHNGELFISNQKYQKKDYLFYPFLKTGQLMMLFGITGEGKSVFAIELANQIAEGKSKWNSFSVETKEQNVLYIDFELGASSLADRYNEYKIHKNLKIFCVDVNSYNLSIGFGRKQSDRIDRAIEFIESKSIEFDSKVIFIDNLSNIADQIEKAAEADRFISDLYGRMKALDLTIIFLGHTPKIPKNSELTINQLKGSSSLTKTFESVIGFRRSAIDKNISYVKQLKTRDLDYVYDDENVAKFEFDANSDSGWTMNFIGTDNEEKLLLKESDGRKEKEMKYDDAIIMEVIYDLIICDMSYTEITKKYNIPKSTIYRFKKMYETDLELKTKLEFVVENKKSELF